MRRRRPRLAFVPKAPPQDLILVGCDDSWERADAEGHFATCPECRRDFLSRRKNGAWKCEHCLCIALPVTLALLDGGGRRISDSVEVPCRFDVVEGAPVFSRVDIAAACNAEFADVAESDAATDVLCEVAGFDPVKIGLELAVSE